VKTPDTEWAKAKSFMHALHANLLLELQNPSSDTAIEQAARLVLQGARDLRVSLHSSPSSARASSKRVSSADEYNIQEHPKPHAGKYLESLAQILLAGKPWGLQGELSEAALIIMLEALSELMGITVTPWQLASTCNMLPALAQAVEQGSHGMQTSGLFLLSQIALTGPSTAVEIAKLPRLLNACYETIMQKHSSEKMTQISALLINNLAAMGGEDAVRVLSAHGRLVRELATWLDNAHDAATLQRLTGVFNHLSRSAVRSPPLAVCLCADALTRPLFLTFMSLFLTFISLPLTFMSLPCESPCRRSRRVRCIRTASCRHSAASSTDLASQAQPRKRRCAPLLVLSACDM
jgi:hypothetical protein